MNQTIERLLGGYESGVVSRRDLLMALSALVAGAGKLGAEPGNAGGGSEGLPAPGGADDARAPATESGSSSTRLQTPPFQGRTLNHTTMFVSDLDRSVEFYQGLFGIPVRSTQANGVNLALGNQNQFLGLYSAPSSGPAIHHVCVGVEDFDPDEAMEKLEAYGIDSSGIRMRGETAELYFTDPDGLSIQIQDVSYCGGGGRLGDEC
ncbi:MAG: VOC family protein [Longimicrobiales bacterium]|nr:VOC family protein [Longimicrobiales bacterium]